MARMIPPYLDESIKSDAEKKIYHLFENSPNTDNWTVIHSLGYRKGIKHPYGEIDFVVLIPNRGIFVLEVKGGRVSCHEGVWSFTDRYGNVTEKNKSPFAQVRDNMFKLKEIIKKIDPKSKSFAKCFIVSGVMFPDIVFDLESIEAHPSEVYDLRSNNDVVGYIKKLEQSGRCNMHQYDVGHISLCYEDINQVINTIRPSFEFEIPLIAQVEKARSAIKRLTEEQYDALDTIECNKRTVVRGYAGTGKTVLAIETAKKYHQSNMKTALFCYNKNLADWLERIFKNAGISLSYIGTFHSYMKLLAGKKVKFFDAAEYYQKILPEACLHEDVCEKFDAIVIDEAQDILCNSYIDVLDHILKDGLSSGRFTMFGDFNLQNLYQQSSMETAKEYLYRKSGYVNFPLKKNCRNSANIHGLAVDSFGIDAKEWKSFAEAGPSVGFHLQKRNRPDNIEDLLDNLISSGIKETEILLLSPYSFYGSIASKITEFNLVTEGYQNTDGISFMTISSSKGLERDVVILLDINEKLATELMYVAITRAKVLLHIFCNEVVAEKIIGHELWQK